jgi:phosphoglycerol transferase MdoB-like AlkP superfamily enzyme
MWQNRHFLFTFIRYHWVYIAGAAGAFAAIIYLIQKKKAIGNTHFRLHSSNIGSLCLMLMLMLFIGIFCIRENIGNGWISPNSSFRFVKPKYYNLIVNPLFNLGYSYLKNINTTDAFIDLMEKKLEPIPDKTIQKENTKSIFFGQFRGKNIFIIIIESASAENFTSSSPSKFEMPFFDSLKKHSLYFSNAYANGYLSSEGVKAIYLGIGNHITEKRIKHPYIKDRAYLANFLSAINYSSSFFYSNDTYAADYWKAVGYSGVTNYYNSSTLNSDFKNSKDSELPDHLFFPLVANKMNEFKEPFISGIANVSTHNPYDRFPGYESYKKQYPTYSQAASMKYLDDVLENFFSSIQKNTWFQNTIFLFIGDHYSRAEDLLNRSDWGLLQIPIMIYEPSGKLVGKSEYPVQQTDIPATIFDMLGIIDPHPSANQSMLIEDPAGREILTRKGNQLLFANDSLFLTYDMLKNKPAGCWNYRKDPKQEQELDTPEYLLNQFYNYLAEVKLQFRAVE